ncbi:MAG TPA: sigma-54 dependent transcriptional regulator [Planctomycetota bacterium]|nr:sigma-54 dependent transcriptional regulator [Planctomycetota bacterium]
MNAPITSEELRGRFESLLAEARQSGALVELRPLLEAALSEATGLQPQVTGTIPMQYGMVGASPQMRLVYSLLDKIVASNVAVLIQGETGTGKELVARALHVYGSRSAKPFLAENCAAVPPDLLESELFGHKKGSFTGAIADRAGHFAAADGGTVFLDEIGDMPVSMQAKLLRVLQEGEVRPVGSNKVIHVDVRIVAATNKDLRAMCRAGTFREDLYFRLAVVTVQLPALRERKGDIVHLVRFLLDLVGKEMGRTAMVTPEAMGLLERWRWPGNVRELENEIRRAMALSSGPIGPAELSEVVRNAAKT